MSFTGLLGPGYWLPAPCLPVVYQQHCHRQGRWFMAVYLHSAPPPPPSCSNRWALAIYSGRAKSQNQWNTTNKGLIVWKSVVITIYWWLRKHRLIPHLHINHQALPDHVSQVHLSDLSFLLILITAPSPSVCVDTPDQCETTGWWVPYIFKSSYTKGPLRLIYVYLLYNCKNIPTAVMFYRAITLNLCKYIQALNFTGCQSFTKREKKKKTHIAP